MRFKYNNKIFETPNLEKKLKRMKLTLSDIEIIELELIKIEESPSIPLWRELGYTIKIYKNIDPNSGNYNHTIETIRELNLDNTWILINERK